MSFFVFGSQPINSTGAAVTDPSTSAIIAQLDSTNFGNTRDGRLYMVHVWVGGNAGNAWQLELASSPNVDSTSILEATVLRSSSGLTSQYIKKFRVDGFQRIRLRQPTAVSGVYEGKLQAEEIV